MLVHTTALEVDGDCADVVQVWHGFLEVVNRLGLTVLGTVRHEFPGGGFSGLVLLGESHAAIHTWPEHGRCWVELATCGDPAALAVFEDAVLGLTPRRVEAGA
jgi:S-adenosylmethionine decarboxylase